MGFQHNIYHVDPTIAIEITHYIKQADIHLSEISVDSRASSDWNFHCSRKVHVAHETKVIYQKEKSFLKLKLLININTLILSGLTNMFSYFYGGKN